MSTSNPDRAPEWARAESIATLVPNGGLVIACEKGRAAICALRKISDVEGIVLLAHVDLALDALYSAHATKLGMSPVEVRDHVAFAKHQIEPKVEHAARIMPAGGGS